MKKKETLPLLKIGTVIEAITTSFGGIKATVTDIKKITSERDHTTMFMYEFEDTGEYIEADEITGDKLFEMKAKRFGGVSGKDAANSIQKVFDQANKNQQDVKSGEANE